MRPACYESEDGDFQTSLSCWSTTITKAEAEAEAEGGCRGLAVAGFGPFAVVVSLGAEESGVVIVGLRAAVNRAARMWSRSWRGRGTPG